MKSKRFLCLLLVLLMAFSLTPSETRAETTVYFTAVNDQLLPDLSDETMPFWVGWAAVCPLHGHHRHGLGPFLLPQPRQEHRRRLPAGQRTDVQLRRRAPSLTRTTASTAVLPSCAATLYSCRSTF